MKSFLLIAGLIFGLCFPCKTQAEGFNAKEFYLDNGLQVIVIENHKAPIVKQMLFYKVGAADEKPGQGGIAHLLEHLMFRGTTKVEGQQFNRILETNGAESNAFTAQDVTAYYQFLDISRLELAMFLEADRMRGLDIGSREFATERDIVFEERKQRVDSNPAALFGEHIRAVLWQGHPYGRPVTGQEEEIKSLTQDMAVDFYRDYYAPNNAVLVLAGDIDLATAKRLASKYYGNLQPSEFEPTGFGQLSEGYKARVEMKQKDARVGRMVKMFAAPSLNVKPEMIYAMDVLAEYLGGDENSSLYQELVVKKKVAAMVDARYDGIARSYGEFVLTVVPQKEMSKEFEQAVERAWRRVIGRLDEQKLNQVKQKMVASLVYLEDNPDTLAQVVGYVAASGGNLDYVQNYAQNINAVTIDDVVKAAKYLQDEAPLVTGLLYPEGKDKE